jgi:hypothetical protein
MTELDKKMLCSYGKDSVYVSGNPQFSFFNPYTLMYEMRIPNEKSLRHTHFSKIDKSYNCTDVQFGSTITITIPKSMHLLADIYLTVVLPESTTAPITLKLDFVLALIKSAKFICVYKDNSKHVFDDISNHYINMFFMQNDLAKFIQINDNNTFNIPIPFFFHHTFYNAFPLLHGYIDHVEVIFEFEKIENIAQKKYENSIFPHLASFSLNMNTTLIKLDSEEERRFTSGVAYEYMIRSVNTQIINDASKFSIVTLLAKGLLKSINWMFRKIDDSEKYFSFLDISDSPAIAIDNEKIHEADKSYFIHYEQYKNTHNPFQSNTLQSKFIDNLYSYSFCLGNKYLNTSSGELNCDRLTLSLHNDGVSTRYNTELSIVCIGYKIIHIGKPPKINNNDSDDD